MIQLNGKRWRMHLRFPEKRGRELDLEFHYESLGVHWRGTAELQPQSFELFDGVPYVAFDARGTTSCTKAYPDEFAMKYMRWENGRWIEIAWREFPHQEALRNLMDPWGYESDRDVQG